MSETVVEIPAIDPIYDVMWKTLSYRARSIRIDYDSFNQVKNAPTKNQNQYLKNKPKKFVTKRNVASMIIE